LTRARVDFLAAEAALEAPCAQKGASRHPMVHAKAAVTAGAVTNESQ
jgi:hypothetical protein